MASMVEMVPASPRHVATIARRMRALDREECAAMGHDPKSALRNGLMISSKAWTAMIDGRAEAMLGVVVTSALTREGTPWFLGTDVIYAQGRALLALGPPILREMGDSWLRLSNLVSCHNSQAMRLLRRWGFDVHDEQVQVGGVAFHPFSMEPR